MIKIIFLLGILFSILIALLSVFLVRRRAINQNGFIIWLVIALLIFFASIMPDTLNLLTEILGVAQPSITLLIFGFVISILLLVYIYQKLSKTINLVINLSQKIAFLESEMDDLKKKRS